MDDNHAHMVIDVALHPIPNIVKKLKGYSAKKLLQEYPWLKKKYFWASGLWNPAYFFDSLGSDVEKVVRYVKKQGLTKNSASLTHWLHMTGG